MLTRESMKGLYVLTITPFDRQGNLDEDAYRDNVRKLMDHGVDGIVTSGTNGEFHTTTDDERKKIARIVVEETRGRAVTIIGASGVNTTESILRSQAALEAGADAVMNVIPFYHILSRAEVYQYFEDLSLACPDIGIIIYNNPITTQVRLDDNDFVRIQEIPNVCGVKMIGADLGLYLNCLRRTTIRHFPLEQLWGISTQVGGNGVMASFIYAFPGYMMRWWQAISAQDLQTSLRMQHEVNAILQDAILPLILSDGYNEIAATKAVVDAAGFLKAGAPRKPFHSVPPDRIQRLRATFEANFRHFLQPV